MEAAAAAVLTAQAPIGSTTAMRTVPTTTMTITTPGRVRFVVRE